ncbi:MAG: hypothetical protein JSS81_29380 [Acidobacteria bacterium]|nr:hypothetical protein [Acidobacteriota bacterium]
MKKIISVSLLLTMLCFAIPAYADGDMTTGNKTCTQNCGFAGLPTEDSSTLDINQTDEIVAGNIYVWITKHISVIFE